MDKVHTDVGPDCITICRKPLNHGHLTTPYNGHFFQAQIRQNSISYSPLQWPAPPIFLGSQQTT